MKKVTVEESFTSIERDPALLIILSILSAGLCWLSYTLFRDMAGVAFALAVPSIILAFHTLWMLLNPFARIYNNKAELRQSWMHNKDHYFTDLVSVGENRGRLFVTYTDGEQETLSLFGIRRSHRRLLKENLQSHIAASSKTGQ